MIANVFFLGYVHTIPDNWHENLFGILLRSIRYVTLNAREGGGYSLEFLVGVCHPVLQILTLL